MYALRLQRIKPEIHNRKIPGMSQNKWTLNNRLPCNTQVKTSQEKFENILK